MSDSLHGGSRHKNRKKNHITKYWTVLITASLATPPALAVVALLEDVR
jgi:hypothetical protein